MPPNRKKDPRTEKTRAALRAIFVQLVLSQGYDAVTVEKIIARANIARSTFYLHYSGKRAILEQSLDVLCEGLAVCVGEGDVAPELVSLLEHFVEQRHINKVFFEAPIRSIWVRCLARRIALHLGAKRARGRRSLPTTLVAVTIAEMQIALVVHWLKNAGSVKPGRIAEALITNTRALATSGL